VTTNMPTESEVDAISLTTRMFVQNNDPVSFRNLATLLDDPGISSGWKEWFKVFRVRLNANMDGHLEFTVNGLTLTKREVFNAFLYGEFAHSSESERAKLDDWRRNPILFSMLEHEFQVTLFNVFSLAANLADVSKRELQGLNVPGPNVNT